MDFGHGINASGLSLLSADSCDRLPSLRMEQSLGHTFQSFCFRVIDAVPGMKIERTKTYVDVKRFALSWRSDAPQTKNLVMWQAVPGGPFRARESVGNDLFDDNNAWSSVQTFPTQSDLAAFVLRFARLCSHEDEAVLLRVKDSYEKFMKLVDTQAALALKGALEAGKNTAHSYLRA